MKIEAKGDVRLGTLNPEQKLQVDTNRKKNIIFGVSRPGEEGKMIKLEEGKFFWKGEEVKDTKKIYERFCKWMDCAEKSVK